MKRIQTLLVITALLIGSCGEGSSPRDDEVAVPLTTVAPEPEVTTEAPTTTEEESIPEAPPVVAECPQGFHSHEVGTCHLDHETDTPDTTAPEEEAPTEEPSEQEETETPETPAEETPAQTEEPSEQEETETPETPAEETPAQTEEPSEQEETETPETPAEETPAQTEEETPTEEPSEQEETETPEDSADPRIRAFPPAVPLPPNFDPDAQGADYLTTSRTESGDVSYEFFYFRTPLDESGRLYAREHEDFVALSSARLSSPFFSFWKYEPYRYDVAWIEWPDVFLVRGVYPEGETRESVFTNQDGSWSFTPVDTPTGAPLPLTTPYREPRYPATAEQLGRNCPPNEELWERGKRVENTCIHEAVREAFRLAYAGTTEQRMAAIRDGHVLGGIFGQLGQPSQRFRR